MSRWVSERERARFFIIEVKKWLHEWGVSQAEFANVVGVYPSQVSLWFRHMCLPREGSMIRMRNAMVELNERWGFEEGFDADQLP